MIWYVIDEGVLRHVIGDQTVMGAQLDRVIEAAGTPGIVIQVLPFTADHAGTDGPISIYEFAEAPAVMARAAIASRSLAMTAGSWSGIHRTAKARRSRSPRPRGVSWSPR
jgi:hypothetical protein